MTLGDSAATCVAARYCRSACCITLSCAVVSAAACDVLSEAMSVVVRLAMNVVDSDEICLGLSVEMIPDICQSRSSCHHARAGSEASELGSTPAHRDTHR